MKMQLLIVNGGEQVILTPENESEKAIVSLICRRNIAFIHKGEVTWQPTRAGYYREFSGDSALLVMRDRDNQPYHDYIAHLDRIEQEQKNASQ